MVRGLDLFKSHFEGYEGRYVLIGGTACSLAMDDAGLDFRATQDLDIVLSVEALDEEISSLSAILLDDAYYHFIHTGKREVEGLSVASPEILIPLKARAWLDLTERKSAGQQVDERDIRKHRNDVFRLYQLMPLDAFVSTPDKVCEDLMRFLVAMETENNVDLNALGLLNADFQKVIGDMRRIYGHDR